MPCACDPAQACARHANCRSTRADGAAGQPLGCGAPRGDQKPTQTATSRARAAASNAHVLEGSSPRAALPKNEAQRSQSPSFRPRLPPHCCGTSSSKPSSGGREGKPQGERSRASGRFDFFFAFPFFSFSFFRTDSGELFARVLFLRRDIPGAATRETPVDQGSGKRRRLLVTDEHYGDRV